MEQYYEDLALYYLDLSFEELEEKEIQFAKICLYDFLGCSIAATQQKRNQSIYRLISAFDTGKKEASIWGKNTKSSVPAATFINSVISSTLEFDDTSSIGASVHPSVSIIPAAIASAEKNGNSGKDFLKALVFGYEISNRFGLLAAEKLRELGLHGPGFMGGLAAVSSAGTLFKLSADQLLNAFSITASLSPVCPFINFIDGCGVKDIYGGWSSYIAMLAIEMAQNGMTGSNRVFESKKSLKSIFASENGKSTKPLDHYYSMDISYKKYPACGSLQAILISIDELLQEESFAPDSINKIIVYTYPYSYDISQMVEHLNPISATLYIPYVVSVMLSEGKLDPQAFSTEALMNEKYRVLMKKVTVKARKEYCEGPFGLRGSSVQIMLNNGKILEKESFYTKSTEAIFPPERNLVDKFNRLTDSKLSVVKKEELASLIFNIENLSNISPVVKFLIDTGN